MTNSTDKPGAPDNSNPSAIDLTEIVDGNVAGDFKEDIVELENMVGGKPSYGEDANIIDLTDVVTSTGEEKKEEEILDLTNIVTDDDAAEKQSMPGDDKEEGENEEFVEVDEDYIEVVDEPIDLDVDVDEKSEQAKSPAMEFDLEKIKELVKQEVGTQLADVYDDEDEEDNDVDEKDPEIIVEPEKIEAAIEKIVQEKFSDNIESVLFGIMEKVMEKEIAEVKKNLQNDLDDITNIIKS
ncbi:MAG: hypothetical protein GY707_09840 [Desulfobacteraceae bacterium]|nr:hypothetical protein [Desulfobacteraceae bacterium]